MTTINAVTTPSIRHAEFVKLSIGTLGSPTTVYTFCNASAAITVDGTTYTNLGSLLNVGDVQRDTKATSDDMTVTLTGIDPNNVSLVLSANIKGSILETYRGFLDSNNQIITTPTQQFFKRYQGIISNVSINEQFDVRLRTRIATCIISSSSMRRVLENRRAGVRTNINSWQTIYPSDTSMNRVDAIQSTFFDFGGVVKKQTQTNSSAP